MFESMSKEEAVKTIVALVKKYYRRFMTKPPYQDGGRTSYAGFVFDEEEMAALADNSLVNSGSSANLAAFMAPASPLLEKECPYRVERAA
jgi:hypothetical protein